MSLSSAVDILARMANSIITTDGLTKSFGTVKAVKGVDLAVEEGTVFGLLGPNGAGKTTTIRILTTLLQPDEGKATVAGFDVVRDAALLRPVIGLAGQFAAVDENLTGLENLEMVGRLYHLPRAEARKRAEEVLERFELSRTRPTERPRRTRAACAGDSTSAPASSGGRGSCSWTSRRRASTPAAVWCCGS